jgi:hypothetical protein
MWLRSILLYVPCLISIVVMMWTDHLITSCKANLDTIYERYDDLYTNYHHFPKEP